MRRIALEKPIGAPCGSLNITWQIGEQAPELPGSPRPH